MHLLQSSTSQGKRKGEGRGERSFTRGLYPSLCSGLSRRGDVLWSCPGGAMYFGNLNDPFSTVSTLSRERRAFRLMEDLGTEPKVYYLSEGM